MYFPAIQSLRFLFILLIVASHLSIIRLPQFDAGGDCGVAFFFVLSGLVTWLSRHQSVENGTFSTKEYLRQRIHKVLWLHIGTWALINLLNHNWDYFVHSLPALFLVQSWIPQSDIYFGGNPVSWFLSDLLLAWILFPVLCRIVQQKWLVPVLVMAYVLIVVLLPEEWMGRCLYILYICPPVRLLDFLLGMALGRWITETSANASHVGLLPNLCAILGTLGIVAGLVFYDNIGPQYRTACFFWPFILALLYAVCRDASCLRFLRQKTLVALGQWSLILYMTHLLALKIIRIGLDRWF